MSLRSQTNRTRSRRHRPTADGSVNADDPLARRDGRWYRPESELSDFAVYIPTGERRYLKTKAGARAALSRLYGDSAD